MAINISKPLSYDIRNAEEADLPGVLEIYNEQIATSTASLRDDPFDLEDRRKWLHEIKAADFPVFVAIPSEGAKVEGNDYDNAASANDTVVPSVLGFAYYSTYRSKTGYRFTVEITFYVHKSVRGRGIGTSLMEALLSHARQRGNVHAVIAVITADNTDSTRFHERFGFFRTGTEREVGYKFGRWHDVIFMELLLLGGPSDNN